MTLPQLKLRLAVLVPKFANIEQQIGILKHQQQWGDTSNGALIAALEQQLITVRQQGKDALFDAMLHTPHCQYLKFIEGKA